MNKATWLALICSLAGASVATADPPCCAKRGLFDTLCNWPVCPPTGCCPDNYVPKALPLINCVRYCGGPDDYCPKPMPNVPCVRYCGGPDDYCAKPLPTLLCPPPSPNLQCGPGASDCAGCGRERRPGLGIFNLLP